MRPTEPQVYLNGYTVRVASLVQIVALLGGGFAAWYSLSAKVDTTSAKMHELSVAVEEARRERTLAVEKLQTALTSSAVDAAKSAAQVQNLELLLGDLRRRFEMLDLSQERRVNPSRILERELQEEPK